VTAKYGATEDADSYFIARMLPITLVVPVSLAFNLAFVPAYAQALRKNGPSRAARLTVDLVYLTFGASLAVTCIYVIFADVIVHALAPGFSVTAHDAAVWMTRIMAFCIVMICMHALFDSILIAHRRFVISAFSSLWIPLGAILGVVVLADRWGITGLASGVLMGFVLSVVMILPVVWKYAARSSRRTGIVGPEARQAYKYLGFTMLLVFVWQVNTAVDRLIASLLGEGAVAALSLGVALIALMPALVALSVYKVLYPEMIQLVSEDRLPELRRLFVGNFLVVSFVMVPVAVTLAMFSTQVTGLLFGYGRFDETAVAHTADVILYLGLGLPAGMGGIFVWCYLLLTRRVRLLLQIVVATLVANALLDLVLMNLMGIGGIALSSSVIATIRVGILIVVVGRLVGGSIVSGLAVPLLKIVAAAALAAVAMGCVSHLLTEQFVTGGIVTRFALAAVVLLIGAGGYLAANGLLRNKPLWQLLSLATGAQRSVAASSVERA
jgi:putative peptidoglycan lipid II flippase